MIFSLINIFQRSSIQTGKLDLPYILLEKLPSHFPRVSVITGVKHIKNYRKIAFLKEILRCYAVCLLPAGKVQLFLNLTDFYLTNSLKSPVLKNLYFLQAIYSSL